MATTSFQLYARRQITRVHDLFAERYGARPKIQRDLLKVWRIVCCVVALALTCVPVFAEESQVCVLYSRRIPTTVRERMIRGGKSKFFGEARLSRENLMFHLYQTGAAKKQTPSDESSLLQYAVDVFSQRPKDKRIHHLNTLRFEDDFEFNTVGMNVIWVDPKTQRIPVLQIRLSVQDTDKVSLLHGPYGTDVVFSFADGFRGKAGMMDFYWGGINNEGYSISYDEKDSRGYMIITAAHQINADKEPLLTKLYWDGKQFFIKSETPTQKE